MIKSHGEVWKQAFKKEERMTGLTNEQVKERIEEGKVKCPTKNPNTRTYKQIILENNPLHFLTF